MRTIDHSYRVAGGLVSVLVLAAATWAQVPPRPEGAGRKRVPRILVEQRFHDLGTMYSGDKATASWTIKNVGTADLKIERTQASCGCAVVKLTESDKVVPAGGSLNLKAEFDSTSRRGEQQKYISILSNDPIEPQTEVQFRANVVNLYYISPAGRVNLRSLHPGQVAPDTMDITPGENPISVEWVDIKWKEDGPFTHTIEPLQLGNGQGHRVRFRIAENAPTGPATGSGTITLKVGDVVRETELQVHAEVVSDLICQPKMISPTGQTLYTGRRLAPLTVRSSEEKPFEVLEIQAPSWLKTEREQTEGKPDKTEYTISLTVGDEPPVGPFGVALRVRTSVASEPILEVPVYGLIAPPITVDPPLIVLKQDGTPEGMHRRVRLQASPRTALDVSHIKCGHAALTAAVDRDGEERSPYLKYLDVKLTGTVSKGSHSTTLMLTTNVPGASSLEIPVLLENPG